MTNPTKPPSASLEEAVLERYRAETDSILAANEVLRTEAKVRRVERYVESGSLLLSQLAVAMTLLLR
jgi:hypothetical protein